MSPATRLLLLVALVSGCTGTGDDSLWPRIQVREGPQPVVLDAGEPTGAWSLGVLLIGAWMHREEPGTPRLLVRVDSSRVDGYPGADPQVSVDLVTLQDGQVLDSAWLEGGRLDVPDTALLDATPAFAGCVDYVPCAPPLGIVAHHEAGGGALVAIRADLWVDAAFAEAVPGEDFLAGLALDRAGR